MRWFLSSFSEHGTAQMIPWFFLVVEIVRKATLTSFHKYWYFLKSKALMFSNIRKRDAFHPGMKYLYGRYCPCCCRDGMQNILASYKRNIILAKKNYCSLLTSFIVLSHLLSRPWSHINSPLRPPKTLSYLRSVKPNTSTIFALLIFYPYNIYIYMNIFYFICIYQYFSCLHSLYSCLATHNSYLSLHLPLLSFFFSCSSSLVSKINEERP